MKRAILTTSIFAALMHAAYAADDNTAADALISRGVELRREGRALEAIGLFQKANAIAPTPRSLGQLGLAESTVERWSDAEEHLEGALASPQDPWVKKNLAALDQALSLSRTHVGQIVVAGPAGAAVVISGRSVGRLPLAAPIRVNSGPALVTASAPGFKQFEMSVPVEAGKETQLQIILQPLQLAASAPVAAPSTRLGPGPDSGTRSGWRTWTGGSLLGAGAAVAAWGIVWIALDGHHATGSCSAGAPSGCVPVYSTKTTGILLTSAGVAAAAAGGILLYTGRPHGSEVGVAVGPTSFRVAARF